MGRDEHMVRDYAPLSARKLDVRLYAQSTTQSDWTVKAAAGRQASIAIPKPIDAVEPLRASCSAWRPDRAASAREDDA